MHITFACAGGPYHTASRSQWEASLSKAMCGKTSAAHTRPEWVAKGVADSLLSAANTHACNYDDGSPYVLLPTSQASAGSVFEITREPKKPGHNYTFHIRRR